jgi:hypothetical protein
VIRKAHGRRNGPKQASSEAFVCKLCIASARPPLSHDEMFLRIKREANSFGPKHFVAPFARQVFRIDELRTLCATKGITTEECLLKGGSMADAIRELSLKAGQQADMHHVAREPSGGARMRSKQYEDTATGAKLLLTHREALHCDVCGYINVVVGCHTCMSTFHAHCLNLLPEEAESLPRGWSCRTCLHEEAVQESQGSNIAHAGDDDSVGTVAAASSSAPMDPGAALDDDGLGLLATSSALPNKPVLCSSCGFHEQDSIQCEPCSRWFCFGCTCLSLQSLPRGSFLCPECIGIDEYDQQISRSNQLIRNRIKEGTVVQSEVQLPRVLTCAPMPLS